MKIFVALFLFAAVAGAYANCGCLQCTKNLHVVSPPCAPIKVIYRGSPCSCNTHIPYKVEEPVCKTKSIKLRDHVYSCQPIKVVKPAPQHLSSYNYQVEVPKHQCKEVKYLVGLVASPDRIVLPAKGCSEPEKPCGTGPIIEYLKPREDDDSYNPYGCGCASSGYNPYASTYSTGCSGGCSSSCSCMRYGSKPRYKRSIQDNIERNIREIFFKDPAEFERYLRREKLKRRLRKRFFLEPNSQEAFEDVSLGHAPFGKLYRSKRENFEEYYKVSEIEGNDLQEGTVGQKKLSDLFLESANWDTILPQIPLFYFVNAPIRMLTHFHKLKNHLEPVVGCVPGVFRTSQQYLTDFGKKFKRSAMSFANDLLSSFERFKRSSENCNALNSVEVVSYNVNEDGTADFILHNKNSNLCPRLTLVLENFDLQNASKIYFALKENSRCKRSILKVMRDGELEALLREKFSTHEEEASSSPEFDDNILEKHLNSIPKLREHIVKPTKMKVTLEKFDPERLLRGINFDFNPQLGASTFFNTQAPEEFGHLNPEKNVQVIKGEISNVLGQIQMLIHVNFEEDVYINNELIKLQTLKNTLVEDWKRALEGGKGKLIMSRKNIVNFVKELDKLRNFILKKAGAQLTSKTVWNRANLIKILARLYKLEIIFSRIVEDLGGKVKFHQDNEENYITQLEKIALINNLNKHNIESDLKEIRDQKVEHNMQLMEKLRKLLDREVTDEIREEINDISRLIQENQHIRKIELQASRDLNGKIRLGKNYRYELKTAINLQRQLIQNEAEMSRELEDETDVNEDVLKAEKPKLSLKERVEEFTKSFEAKRAEWIEKNKKNIKSKIKI